MLKVFIFAVCKAPVGDALLQSRRLHTVSMRSVVSKEAYVLFFELANASSL